LGGLAGVAARIVSVDPSDTRAGPVEGIAVELGDIRTRSRRAGSGPADGRAV